MATNVIAGGLASVKAQAQIILPVNASGDAIQIATTGIIGGMFLPLAGGTLTGDLGLASGVNIIPGQSGTSSLGSASFYFKTAFIDTLTASNIVSSGDQGMFVNVTGDSMTGQLTMAGANIVPSVSGANFLGTQAVPFSGVVAKIIFPHTFQGPGGAAQNMIWYENGDIDLASVGNFSLFGGGNFNANFTNGGGRSIVLSSTADGKITAADAYLIGSTSVRITGLTTVAGNLLPEASSTRDLGTTALHWSNLYLDAIGNGIDIKGNANVIGQVTSSGMNAAVSGSNNIGSAAVPWNQIFVKTIVTSGSTAGYTWAFSETPTGSINSSNVTYTLAHTPLQTSLQLYQNGVRQIAATDYTLAGLTITYVTAPTTGASLIADYIW